MGEGQGPTRVRFTEKTVHDMPFAKEVVSNMAAGLADAAYHELYGQPNVFKHRMKTTITVSVKTEWVKED
jgi:hypothetical protein